MAQIEQRPNYCDFTTDLRYVKSGSTRNLNCKYTQTQHAVEHLSYPARFVFKILLLGIWYLSVKNDQIKS